MIGDLINQQISNSKFKYQARIIFKYRFYILDPALSVINRDCLKKIGLVKT